MLQKRGDKIDIRAPVGYQERGEIFGFLDRCIGDGINFARFLACLGVGKQESSSSLRSFLEIKKANQFADPVMLDETGITRTDRGANPVVFFLVSDQVPNRG